MAGKNTAVFGLYRDEALLNHGVDALRAAGYRNTEISVLVPENRGTKDFAHEKQTKAPKGTNGGAVSGLAIGGTLGWLAGIGALAIPGIGQFITGPIVAALAGAGAGGALGGLSGALVGMGIPEYEAKRYGGGIRSGGILMSVHCNNSEWIGHAKEILRQTGAEDIGSADVATANSARSDKPLPRGRTNFRAS
jgi:hypothetical protein